jgi:hypothetical protein
MVEQEFVAILNLSLALDVLKVVGAHFAITDMLVDLCLLFINVVPTCDRTRSDLVNLLSMLLIMTNTTLDDNHLITLLGLVIASDLHQYLSD